MSCRNWRSTTSIWNCALAEGAPIEIVPVLGSVTDARLVRKVLGAQQGRGGAACRGLQACAAGRGQPAGGPGQQCAGHRDAGAQAREVGVERFILVSSDKAVRPTNVMGASKRLAELVVQDLAQRSAGTVFTMVRFGNVLGSSGSVDPAVSGSDRPRRPGDADPSGCHALFHDRAGGRAPGAAGRASGQGRRGLRAGHGRSRSRSANWRAR